MLALLIAAALATAAPSAAPTVSSQTATIVTSPSTNTAGYRIVISPDGDADLTTAGGVAHARLDPNLVKRLYADLARAGALDALPAGHCMKSASFGTSTWIGYRGANSPDVQCAQNEVERALAGDARAIVGAVTGK
jgi:hypothetical protein